MRLAGGLAELQENLWELPKPNTKKVHEAIPELEELRALTGAREIYLFVPPGVGRGKLLALSPPALVKQMPAALSENDYEFVHRAGCTFAFEAKGLKMRLGEPSALCKTADGRSVETAMAKTLGRLILKDEKAILRQVADFQPTCLAIASEAGHALIAEAEHVAASSRPAIILGESGAGKDMMSRLIHQLSGRTKYVGNSMAQVRGELAISELFGHVRGAYSGAINGRLGAFRAAGDGTLFLDEIGDVPESIAALLLRAIEEKVVKPLGSDETTVANARVLAATNRPEQVRRDLFYRFVHRIVIPPLRKRPADIRAIARYLSFRDGFEITDKALGLLEVLLPWKGNARELEYFLLHAASGSKKPILGAADIMKAYATAFTFEIDEFHSPVRQLRTHLGMGVREFAKILDIPKSTLDDLEKSGSLDHEMESLVKLGEKLASLPRNHNRREVAAAELRRFIQDE